MSKTGIVSNGFISKSTITSVNFGSSCTYVGQGAFKDCISLEKINENNVIEKIEGGAFAGTNLYSVKFNNLKTISNMLSRTVCGAFEKCPNLTYVDIKNCTQIPSGTFVDCNALSEINAINCISVGNFTFSGCQNLNIVDIKSCTHIGKYAFRNCINLTNVNINNTNIVIEDSAFINCCTLSNFNFKNCRIIGSNAFRNCISIENVNLDTCQNIGRSAFYNCKKLKQITLSNKLTYGGIQDQAFINCENLSRVYINTNLSTVIPLGSSVFYTNSAINSNIRFYLGNDIYSNYFNHANWSEYKDYMFRLAGKQEIIYTTNDGNEIDIEDAEIEVNKYNNGCGIIKFKSPIQELNTIFSKNTELTSVILPEECESIGDYSFNGCTNLEEFTPSPSNTLKKIGNYAFKDCVKLTSFTIPESITTLGEGVFAGCSSIKKFEGNFVTYDGKAIVYDNTLICVLPKDNNNTEGRIYDISEIDKNITKLGKSCFYGCKELRRVDIHSIIEEIGEGAFEGCTNLREVHFNGNIVPTIGSNVFGTVREDFKIFVPENKLSEYCSKLSDYEKYIYPKPNDNYIIYYGSGLKTVSSTSVELENVTNGTYYKVSNANSVLPEEYFSNQVEITKVILGENITEINNNSFINCKNLKYIYIPNTITKFGHRCFSNCESLESINIPNKYSYTYTVDYGATQSTQELSNSDSDPDLDNIVENSNKKHYYAIGKTSFGDEMFSGCSNLKEFVSYYSRFVSEDGRCYIDDKTLKFFAPSTTEYTIPDKVSEINKYAFKGYNINKIDLNNTEKIGEYAFEGCTSLTTIDKLNNITTILNGAFKGCSELNNISSLNENLNTINESVFENCKKISSIPLNYITTISKYAFRGCDNLSVISIPSKLETIGESAFEGCGNMYIKNTIDEKTNMTYIPTNITIGNRAFKGCGLIGQLEFVNPEGNDDIKFINSYVFEDCKNLTSVVINNSIETINTGAFSNCNGLTKIIIKDNSKLKNIYGKSFMGCKNLKSINIPNSVNEIGEYAFYECGFTTLKIPTSVSKIGDYCFAKTKIKELNITQNSKLTSLQQGVFNNCESLTTVTISSTNMKTIGVRAFESCVGLNNISLSNTIETINDNAFNNTKLTSITLPSNLKKIGNLCLYTGNLRSVYINSSLTNPPTFTKNGSNNTTSNPFGDVNDTTHNIPEIYVQPIPLNMLTTYKTNQYWKKYSNSIKIINTRIEEFEFTGGPTYIK